MTLYEKVKTFAEKKLMSIAAVEKAAGLANGTIGKWRTSSAGVRLESVKAVAAVLCVRLEELL